MYNLKFIIIFSILSFNVSARNYYVANTGSNSNTGTIVSPFAKIQFALDNCQAGDSVIVRSGTYFEKLVWKTSGGINSIITLKNFGNEQVIVDGTGISGNALLTINNFNYLEIIGITFQNNYLQDAKGIYVFGEGNHIYIKNCIVKNIGWTTNPNADPFGVTPNGQAHGILFNGRTTTGLDDVKVLNCTVNNIITGNSEAITLVGNIDGFEIDRTSVYDTKNIGIVAAGHYSWAIDAGVTTSLNQSRNGIITNCVVYNNRRFSNTYAPAGIYVDGGRNIKIIGNKSYKNGNGISVGCENPGASAREITVMNNVVYDNDNHGILFGSNNPSSLLKKSTLINNTFFQNGSFDIFRLEINLQNSDSCIIANNIAIPRTDSHYGIGIFGYTVSHITINNNLLYRYSGNTTFLYVPGSPAQFSPTNTITANPVFIDATISNPNLYIDKTSPAINVGTHAYALDSEIDITSQFRIVNGVIDIGAYERQDGGCPSIHTINNTQLLKGKFIASQAVQFNMNPASVINSPLFLSSRYVKILGLVNLNNLLKIDGVGCQ